LKNIQSTLTWCFDPLILGSHDRSLLVHLRFFVNGHALRAPESAGVAMAPRRQLLVRRLRGGPALSWRTYPHRGFPGRTDSGYRYESDIRIHKDCQTPMSEIDAAYRNELAQLPAHDIKEIEWFD
jgi:hypothetical protein